MSEKDLMNRVTWKLFFLLACMSQGFAQKSIEVGKSLIEKSYYDSARRYFKTGLDSCLRSNCSNSDLADFHIHLGRVLTLTNEYDSAIYFYMAGIDLKEHSMDNDGVAFGKISLAEMYRSSRQFDKGLLILRNLENNSPDSLSPENQAFLYNRLAAIISEYSADLDQVLSYSRKVLHLARETGDQDLEASSLNEIAFVLERQEDSKAIDYYQIAYKLYEKLGNTRYVVSVLTNQARTLHKFEQFSESVAKANHAIEIAEDFDWIKALPDLYEVQFKNHIKLNRGEIALAFFNKYHDTYLKARELEWNESLYSIQAKFDLAEKERQLSEVRLKETLARVESEQKSRQLNYTLVLAVSLTLFLILLFRSLRKTRRANNLLQESLVQKDLLRQEIHHRIKNNLTFLKSLLFITSDESANKEVKSILNECQLRIQAMTLVHQNLYGGSNSDQVYVQSLIQGLFNEIRNLYAHDLDQVKMQLETGEIKMDMNRSMMLGLILQELMTNSFKYAFGNGEQGSIHMSFAVGPHSVDIAYGDSGPGISPGKFETSEGFGFKLIKILVEQVHGVLDYREKIFHLSIPK